LLVTVNGNTVNPLDFITCMDSLMSLNNYNNAVKRLQSDR